MPVNRIDTLLGDCASLSCFVLSIMFDNFCSLLV